MREPRLSVDHIEFWECAKDDPLTDWVGFYHPYKIILCNPEGSVSGCWEWSVYKMFINTEVKKYPPVVHGTCQTFMEAMQEAKEVVRHETYKARFWSNATHSTT